MKDDPTRLRLPAELRQLRRGNGNLSADRIAVSEELVKVIGIGSAEQAYATLVDILKRYAVEPEGDIRAFLETWGVGLGGGPSESLDLAQTRRRFNSARAPGGVDREERAEHARSDRRHQNPTDFK